MNSNRRKQARNKKGLPRIEYGLAGIKRIFNISKSTALRYRHTIIADACTQQGNKIIIDTEKALRLFGIKNPENMLQKLDTFKHNL